MAQTAEQVGFDSIWLGDHLLYDLAVGPRGPWEVWTSLAALAASTERVLLGPLVASTGFHEPTMLAKQAATVDAISDGRLIVGLGAGWNEREYRAFGFPFDRRVSRFEEAFTIIRCLLADGSIDFAGEFYRAERCVLHPRPPRAGWAAVDGRLGATPDAVDHPGARRRVERVVERLRQQPCRVRHCQGGASMQRPRSAAGRPAASRRRARCSCSWPAGPAGRWVHTAAHPSSRCAALQARLPSC